MTVNLAPRISRFACFKDNCDWVLPEGYMTHCPVCKCMTLKPDFGTTSTGSFHEGSYCVRCSTRFYYPIWKGEE